MLCVIPFFAGDKDQAIRLALWIRDLGGVKNHDALLVVDAGTTAEGVYEPLSEAFRSVSKTTAQPAGAQGSWGNGTTDATAANEMWLAGATYVYHKSKAPFCWLEPDAAPTRATWLDEIEAEYLACGKPFMGMRVDMPPHEVHMSGIGCYPFDVANHSVAMMMPGKTAWDYAGRKDTVGKGKAHFTDLIQHVYRVDGESPSFPTLESLAQIHPRTAVYHRCKSPCLIERLREQKGMIVLDERPAIAAVQVQVLTSPPTPRERELEARVKELEAMFAAVPLPKVRKVDYVDALKSKPFPPGLGETTSPALRAIHRNPIKRRKKKRTPAEQTAINDRMAKARAARKPKMTGVL